MKLQSILPTRAINALCKLLSDYRAQTDNRATLAELQEILGPRVYSDLSHDLRDHMNRMSAWRAVATVITAAIQRKKEAERA